MSHSCSQSNALVFEAGLVEKRASTRPLAISAALTAPVVLHEGFDVTTDVTRLVSEGYGNYVISYTHTFKQLCVHT